VNVRPATEQDFPAMLELIAEDEEHLLGHPSRLALGDLREWLSRVDLAEDTWLYESDGELCALGWCDLAPGSDAAFAAGIVRPRFKAHGIGASLLERSESRSAARGAKRMHQFALGKDAAAASLMAAHGYSEVRRFYEMAIELSERPQVPDIRIETLNEAEASEFHAALDEAFQDHWEHHSLSFEEWWSRHSSSQGFDLSLYFLIRDGGEIAAASRNEANRNGGGYVAAIGVRRPWRGKGYAKALLLHTFRELYDRGITRVTLGVDAQSPTGATHLYERVGMHVEQENVVFEKALP
jgi:mycothiol synthase